MFGEDRLVCEIGVAGVPSAFCEVAGKWVCGCQDGHLYGYEERKQLWKQKGKAEVLGLQAYQEYFLAWRKDTHLELRDQQGKTLSRIKIIGGISSVLVYDYRREDKLPICVFTPEGMLKAFTLETKEAAPLLPTEKVGIH